MAAGSPDPENGDDDAAPSHSPPPRRRDGGRDRSLWRPLRGGRRSGGKAGAEAEASSRRPRLLEPDRHVGRRQARVGVNPADDSVSVIRTDQNKVVKKIKVGDEPQSVALDPAGRYAYVANAAGSSLTVIRITNARPARFAAPRTGASAQGTADHRRRAVGRRRLPGRQARLRRNSGQDTITVLDVADAQARRRRDLRKSLCNAQDQSRDLPAARDGGHRRQQEALRHALPLLREPGRRSRRRQRARRASSAASTSTPDAKSVGAYGPAQRITLGSADHRLQDRLAPATPTPDATSAFPNQLQSIVIRGNHAYLPNIAASPYGPAALQRRHAGLRQRDRRRQRRHARPTRARPSSSTCTSAPRSPSPARRSSSSPTSGPSGSPEQRQRLRGLGRQRPAGQGQRRRQRQAGLHRSTRTRRATST